MILERDDKSLAFYKVSNESTLHMSVRWNSKDACEEFKEELVESMTCEMNKEVEIKASQFKKLENERIEISAKVSELEERREKIDIEYQERKEANMKYRAGIWEYYSKARNQKAITEKSAQ